MTSKKNAVRITPQAWIDRFGFGIGVYLPFGFTVRIGRFRFYFPKDRWFCSAIDPWYSRWVRIDPK